jgi:hypothetical protein
MHIKIFNTGFKAVSNVFVDTIDDKSHCFSSPIRLHATISEESGKSVVGELSLLYPVYLSSPFIIDYYIDLFFYALAHDYVLHTYLFKQILLTDYSSEMSGYTGKYMFDPANVVTNICELSNQTLYSMYTEHEEAFYQHD